ncbi:MULTISPECIES: MarR family winged helix-turn-helix transcriptional regulator [Pseudolactococcus]|jgi:DNA-binding MarR family transcriptional regulator|uniref:Transcriptional regulator MarR family protein n=2 Tax=Pseudolactococcus TaxID=3436058 RepID=A0A0D6DX76_9LACT|nr:MULTISPECIES: MarR family transcriptional regulator [Lactococcus]MBR6896038.1 MarR family transcriptional regulator [Lactococcus sp.]MCJ1988831.1 MarR family transcriptional regulator [Lactococcus carnosus]CEN28559.1 Transcriptional regulator MarR family protein [Lactococcus piscium MKFS47]
MVDNLVLVNAFREFNRFYTLMMGTLNHHFLDSEFSIAESRLLFELYANHEVTANFLVSKLHIDKSYVSRILKSFERKALLTTKQAPEDKRVIILSLTPKGTEVISHLIIASNQQLSTLISPLNALEKQDLLAAMQVMMKLFSKTDLGE